MIILSSKSNGNCIKDSPRTIAAGRAKPLGLALEAQAAIAPHKQFINCRPARDLVKARPAPTGKTSPLDLALGGLTRYCAA